MSRLERYCGETILLTLIPSLHSCTGSPRKQRDLQEKESLGLKFWQVMVLLHLLLGLIVHNTTAYGPCPADSSTNGYSDWFDLKCDLENAAAFNGVYVLCPGSTLDASGGLIDIERPGTIVQCGADGNESDCDITGGRRQFQILCESVLLSGSTVHLRGLTMRNASSPVYLAAILFGSSGLSSTA